MPSWVQRVSFLLLFLLAFDASSLVFGTPQLPTRVVRQLAQPVRYGDTNAKRFARGLPPLPPVRRASRTDSARRSTTSDTEPFCGKIKVSSVQDQSTIGFLQLSDDRDRYIAGPASSATKFSATVSKQSVTYGVSFHDDNAPLFLAGLISPGVELLLTNSNAAIIGGTQVQTTPGSTPHSGGPVSIPGSEYETAIWKYSASPPSLSPSWVDHDGNSPPISIVWDPVGKTLYLTANPTLVKQNHPGSETVELMPVG